MFGGNKRRGWPVEGQERAGGLCFRVCHLYLGLGAPEEHELLGQNARLPPHHVNALRQRLVHAVRVRENVFRAPIERWSRYLLG